MAKYVGGPCDGQDAGAALYVESYCGGVKYVLAEDGNYHALGATYPGGTLAGERQAYAAWSGLMRELAVKTPHALSRARAVGKRMRRVVR
jgi:hypothetical protein